MGRPSRSLVLRLLVALAIGLLEPSLELAWKCRAGREASEACVWGRAYLPVSRALGLLVIAPVAFAVLTVLARVWRRNGEDPRPSL